MSGNTYTDANKILWADIGERLGLDKNALRDFRKTFSDVLGLDVSHPSVSPDMVPVLERVQFVRQRGYRRHDPRERVTVDRRSRLPDGSSPACSRQPKQRARQQPKPPKPLRPDACLR